MLQGLRLGGLTGLPGAGFASCRRPLGEHH
jgi:hypothetical protein